MIFGGDAVALYPSLNKYATGMIVREQIEKSQLKCEGLNWEKIRLNLGKDKWGSVWKNRTHLVSGKGIYH